MSVLWKLVLLVFTQIIYCHEEAIEILDPNDGQLIFANTICRHGDRNVFKPYPKDPWGDEQLWPGGFAQLTFVGQQEHYELGKYLRKRYSSLLGDGTYSADKVYIGSTGSDRTLTSAMANMASMFPPPDDKKLSEDLNWMPIPVHSMPMENDYILAAQKQCDRYDFEIQKITNGTMYKELLKRNKPLLDYLQEHSGFKMKTLSNVTLLYDALYTQKMKGKCIPDWAEKVINNENFKSLALFFYEIQSYNNELKKIKPGYLLKSIFDRIRSKIQSTLKPDRKLFMYFAHDITIVTILNGLGLYKGDKPPLTLDRPPLTSCLLFELYKKEENHYVQIFFKNSTATKLPALDIPGCGTKCSTENFYELYKDILPTQSFEKECALRDWEYVAPVDNPEIFFFTKLA